MVFLVEVARFGNRRFLEFYKQCIGIFKVMNSHGTNLRSKNALWTVSLLARRIIFK